MERINRNDPCPCGSGLKFKKCCLKKGVDANDMDDQISSLRATAFKEMSNRNWQEAIDKFKEFLDAASDKAEIYEALAACYDGLENYLLAAEHYEKALALCGPHKRLPLTYRLGVSRGCAERLEKAHDAFQQCLELADEPEIKEQIQRLISTLEAMMRGDAKPSLFKVQVQLQKAFADMDEERYEEAAARLEAAAALEPENPAIFYNLGVAYTFLGNEDLAISHFRRCLDLNPMYAQAWYNQGQIYLIKKQDFGMARQCFEMAVAIRPDYVGAHHQRGIACENMGDKEKAIECWERTLELDPENAMARDNIQRLKAPGQKAE